MEINEFFKQIDDTDRSKSIENKAKEAKKRVLIECAINFANKLSETTIPYEKEFEKRGFKCEKRTGNLPYWSLEIKKNDAALKIAIVHDRIDDFQIASYWNDTRINNHLSISEVFDKMEIEKELQRLFQHLI